MSNLTRLFALRPKGWHYVLEPKSSIAAESAIDAGWFCRAIATGGPWSVHAYGPRPEAALQNCLDAVREFEARQRMAAALERQQPAST